MWELYIVASLMCGESTQICLNNVGLGAKKESIINRESIINNVELSTPC